MTESRTMYSILLIDDMKPLVMIMESGLKRLGQRVFSAYSGQEGLDLYQNKDFDVVICDLGMEGLSGWDVGKAVKELCAKQGKPKTPFILLTGWGCDFEDEADLTRAGVDVVLEKPVELDNLLKILQTLVPK